MRNINNHTKLSSKLRNHPVAKDSHLYELMMILADDICRRLHLKTDTNVKVKSKADEMIAEENQ